MPGIDFGEGLPEETSHPSMQEELTQVPQSLLTEEAFPQVCILMVVFGPFYCAQNTTLFCMSDVELWMVQHPPIDALDLHPSLSLLSLPFSNSPLAVCVIEHYKLRMLFRLAS